MSLSPSQILGFVLEEDALIYNTVAASAFFFWDYCITFDQEEVELIWSSKQSWINLFFYAIRYLTVVIRIFELVIYTNISGLIEPSQSNCVAWVKFEVIAGHVLYSFIEILLIMRVFAFYGRNKILVACLFPIIIIEHAACFVIFAITVPKILVVPSPLPPNLHAAACLIVEIPALFTGYWIPGLIFESMLFLLVAVKFIRNKWGERVDSPPYLVVFVRDGAWAFGVLFALLIWATLAFELSPQKGDVALTWIYTILGFSGSRLILNLRSAAQEHKRIIYDTGVELNFLKNGVSGTSGNATTTIDCTSGVERESQALA